MGVAIIITSPPPTLSSSLPAMVPDLVVAAPTSLLPLPTLSLLLQTLLLPLPTLSFPLNLLSLLLISSLSSSTWLLPLPTPLLPPLTILLPLLLKHGQQWRQCTAQGYISPAIPDLGKWRRWSTFGGVAIASPIGRVYSLMWPSEVLDKARTKATDVASAHKLTKPQSIFPRYCALNIY